jgi:plastocyanin
MASNSAPIVDRIRIIPRPDDFLNRNVGSSGEVFFNKVTNSLRVYSGKDVSGFEIARADLNNVTGASLLSKLTITNDDISWIAYAELVDLPSAADNHGMFAHVHGTGKAYYAHAGAWIQLANQADITSIADISELTDTTNLLFDGAYSSLTSPPTIPALLTDLGITDGATTQILTTDGAGNFTFEDAPETGTTQNLFATITSDDGSATANTVTDTLNVLGGTNIATTIATDTDNLTINMSAFSIDFLSDVDTTSSSPATGNVLKWDGAKWAPGVDATTGGGGTDADTLDGFDGSYYLDWANVANKPSILTLASLSVGVEPTAAGDGAISYDNTSGEFRYTPPDLSTYLTSVPAQTFASLTSKPTTLSGYGITDAQSTLVSGTDIKTINGTSLLGSGNIAIAGGGSGIALTDLSVGTEGSASGNGAIAYNDSTGVFTYTPPVVPAVLTDLGITDGSSNQVLTTNGSGTFTFTTQASGVTTFSALSDVTTASIDIGKIYEPAIAMLRVNNVGTGAYTINSHYSGNNPTIYVISGTTIAFDLDEIAGHPFELQDNTLTALTSNLVHVTSNGTVSTNSAAQGKSSGTLYWRIPESVSGTYVYQCTSHSSMFGSITIKDLSNL